MSDDAIKLEDVRTAARRWFEESWDPLADSGYAVPTWPREWYGLGLSSRAAAVVHEERKRAGAYGAPSGIGVMMAGPTIVSHGTDE